jgi:hypothetical protein
MAGSAASAKTKSPFCANAQNVVAAWNAFSYPTSLFITTQCVGKKLATLLSYFEFKPNLDDF